MFFFVIGAFGTNAQPASGGCSTQRVWDYPNQAFCNSKMAFVYTNALLAHATHPFRVLPLYTDRIVSTRTATKVVLKICGSSTLILYMEKCTITID